jgi:NDP-sugar pyrophosphorylase family protein
MHNFTYSTAPGGMLKHHSMKAMIFAAGLGKRLGNLTKDTPKALIEINGKTILRLAVEKVTAFGFDDIIVNIHHHADMVEKEIFKLKSDGFRIAVSDERDLLLETGGGLFKAKWFFDDKPFLLYNSDVVTSLDLSALLAFHIEKGGLATLAGAERKDNRVFLVNSAGLLFGWRNRQGGEEIMSRESEKPLDEISFSGIHIVDPLIFNYMQEGVYSMTAQYLEMASSQNIYIYRHDQDLWIDVGTPDKLEEARERLKKHD